MSVTVLVEAISRILVLVGVGAVLRLTGLLKRADSKILNAVIVYAALPALIFTVVAKAELSLGLLRAAGVAWAVSLVGLAVAWVLARALKLPPATAGGFIIAAAIGNTGYIGYPVVRTLLGEAAMPAAVFYDVFGTVGVLFTIGVAIAARYGEHEGKMNVLKELFTFPAMVALLVALAFRLVQWPDVVSRTVMDWTGLAGTMAVPLIMVSLGVSLDFSAFRGSWTRLGALAGIKLLLLPALALGIALALGEGDGTRLLVLQAGMPSVMLSLVVGQRFKLDTEFIAAAILTTTVGCLVTIPLVQLLVH